MADEDGDYWFLRLWCQRLTFLFSSLVMVYISLVLYTWKYKEGGVICPDFRFDQTYLHKDLQIEEEGYVLTNTNRLTRRNDGQLKQYRGVVGAVPLNRERKTVLVLRYLISMKSKAGDRTPLLHVGFVQRQHIDKPGQTSKGFLIAIMECQDKTMCLVVKKKELTRRKIPLFKNNKDSFYSGRLIILISSSSMTVAFTGVDPTSEIAYTFEEIDIHTDMWWPFYGIFNPDIANVTITFPSDEQTDAVFDQSTCHDGVFISPDGQALSNVMMGDNFRTGYKVGRQMYRGVVGDMSYEVHQIQYQDKPFYFAIQITGDIEMRKLNVKEILFEIGFAPKDVVEKHSTLQYHKKAWSLHFSRCSTLLRICVEFMERGKKVKTLVYNIINDELLLSSTISVEIEPNVGSLKFYGSEGDLWQEYQDVDFSFPLFPVFGMTDKSFLKMKLLTEDKVPNYNVLGYFGSSPVCDI
ncbi:hypothetical protein FSP39_008338 [Pinctada imbricata]|uniref:Uncharacterized protein n=1 Tax=Pinctada imbricata TaxID=66713 RepID=A0AA88XZS3_PINIB|nr:hypothetical protein FSP39_008338 [Pinctada imbricata]